MSKAVKEMMTQELASQLEGMENCLVVNYIGLSVPDTDVVRRELRRAGMTLTMVNNSLATRALERVGLERVAPLLQGPSAFLQGGAGPVEAAKAFTDMMKKRPALVLRGGYVEGEVLSPDQVKDLAKIPPREVLLSQILAGIQAPLSGLAGVLSGVPRRLAMALKAIAEQKGGDASDEAVPVEN